MNSFVCFLEEIDDPKNLFEINWPLVNYVCFSKSPNFNLSKITSITYRISVFEKKMYIFYLFRSCHTVAKDTLYFTCKISNCDTHSRRSRSELFPLCFHEFFPPIQRQYRVLTDPNNTFP